MIYYALLLVLINSMAHFFNPEPITSKHLFIAITIVMLGLYAIHERIKR